MVQQSVSAPGALHYRGFPITLKYSTFGRNPRDDGSARYRGLYVTTHNNHERLISMPGEGFEPTIPASERLQTLA
jgi:hypothetical protein